MKKIKVCIPTAGIGKRLGNFTKVLNKSLVDIDLKPAISHIIDNFPKNTEFVIPLGYKGTLVKNFLQLTYPERKFYFVYVSKFKGNGSGLGLTLLKAKKYLQSPFIFISCDTIFKGSVGRTDLPGGNWSQLESSLINLVQTVDPCIIVHSGHGPDTTFKNEIGKNPFLIALNDKLNLQL